MMRSTRLLTLIAALASSLACSGRYRIGAVDSHDGPGADGSGEMPFAGTGGATMVALGSGGSADLGGGSATAGSSTAGGMGALGDMMDIADAKCVATGDPPALSGPFAEPEVVWGRLSLLISGEVAPMPVAKPEATTYAWAAELAKAGRSQNSIKHYGSGPRLFLAQWLGVDVKTVEQPSFFYDWDARLDTDAAALDVLLNDTLEDPNFKTIQPGRFGIFSERALLELRPNISSRGQLISSILLRRLAPSHPKGVGYSTPGPNDTERDMLEASTQGNAVCNTCHGLTDGLGDAYGRFDATGNLRSLDNGLAIDTSGTYQLGSGKQIVYTDLQDLNDKLWQSCEVNLAFADDFLQAALAITQTPETQRETLFNADQARFRQAYLSSDRSYPALVKAYAQTQAALEP